MSSRNLRPLLNLAAAVVAFCATTSGAWIAAEHIDGADSTTVVLAAWVAAAAWLLVAVGVATRTPPGSYRPEPGHGHRPDAGQPDWGQLHAMWLASPERRATAEMDAWMAEHPAGRHAAAARLAEVGR
jgi:hypothetical protein